MAGYIGSKSSVTLVDGYSEAEADAEFVTKTGDTMTGDLNLGANSLSLGANNANSPQILFENSDGVTGDAALSTYDDTSGTMLVMGSNFYINSSGSESRFNTSEESSAVMLNRNGDLNLLTGGTGATATTRLKIDSLGNVGIGGTPSAAYKMQVNVATNTVSTGSPAASSIANISGGTATVGDGVSLQLTNVSGAKETGWRMSAVTASGNNGDLVFNGYAGGADYPERMRISSSGNVGIGNSIPSSFNGGANNLVVGSGSGAEGITIYGGAESNIFFADGTSGSDAYIGRIEYSHTANDMKFYVNNANAMRIHGSGGISFGTGNDFGSVTSFCTQSGKVASVYRDIEGNGNYIIFQNSGSTAVGSITRSGSSTVYATSSDYRLKENVDYTWDATTRLKQLKPARFNFISDADKTVDGFLAHEVADVVPEAITGTKDAMKDEEYEVTPAVEATYDEDGNELTAAVEAVMGTRSVPDYQGIDQSKLVPLLTAALQEALTEIASLKTRVEALEA